MSGRRNETLQCDLEAGSFTGVAGNEDSIPGGRVVSRGREHTLAACAEGPDLHVIYDVCAVPLSQLTRMAAWRGGHL